MMPVAASLSEYACLSVPTWERGWWMVQTMRRPPLQYFDIISIT